MDCLDQEIRDAGTQEAGALTSSLPQSTMQGVAASPPLAKSSPLPPAKKLKKLEDLPNELLIKIARHAWSSQLEHEPESSVLIRCNCSNQHSVRRPHLPLTYTMPLILVNKNFHDLSISIPFEEVRIDGRVDRKSRYDGICQMESLYEQISRPGGNLIDLVKAIDLEINFEQSTNSISNMVAGLASLKALKHLRITALVNQSLHYLSYVFIMSNGISVAFEEDGAKWSGNPADILQFFALDLETLTFRFHRFTKEDTLCPKTYFPHSHSHTHTISWSFVPAPAMPSPPIDMNSQRDEWIRETFHRSKFYEVLGDGEEVNPEEPTGLPASFKGTRYRFPLKEGSRATMCPDWPMFTVKRPTKQEAEVESLSPTEPPTPIARNQV